MKVLGPGLLPLCRLVPSLTLILQVSMLVSNILAQASAGDVINFTIVLNHFS